MNQVPQAFKSGFVGIVGPTNSGKSTLLNSLVGQKISIVSRRAQTTYHGVRGILNTPTAQIVFIDTPGFQQHPSSVARLLNKVAEKSAREADILVWVFDASAYLVIPQIEKFVVRIKGFGGPEKNLCVLNKIDKIAKPALLPMLARVTALGVFSEIIPISALSRDGVDRVTKCLELRLSVGTPYFPLDMVTDRPSQFLVSEIIREKIYEATHQEIPYSARIEIESWETPETGKRIPNIRATIHVDSQSKRAILIGKGGHMLKRIGSNARREAEKLVGGQICLKLHVDVEQDWKTDPRVINTYLELT